MALRLIAGRAGSGKTHYCQTEACRQLMANRPEGPRLIMLVPEQAGLQMERSLLSMLTPPALGRCDVLSFRRLAHRVFNESSGPTPALITPTGRQMALRYIIARHSRKLREFSRVSDRAGFLATVAAGIVELLQEAVTPDHLENAARAAEAENDPTSPRLHDMAIIFRAYLEYLGSQRVDPEAVLDLARSRLTGLDWPDGSRIWIDGFAGLTQQQIRMTVALAARAAHVDVALLLDPKMRRVSDLDAAPDDLSLFARTDRTWFALARAARDAGVHTEEPVILGGESLPRFSKSTQLARLERSFFHVSASCADPQPVMSSRESGVHLLRVLDRREEVEVAAAAIVDLVQRGSSPLRYRDVAIVVRDLTPYHDLISSALTARGIPFFIDRRRPTFHHPLVQFVRAVLGILGGAPFDQCILTILKSGLSGLEEGAAAAIENYILAHGLSTAALWESDWPYPVRAAGSDAHKTSEDAESLRAINQSRRWIVERLGVWLPGDQDGARRPLCQHRLEGLMEVMDRFAVRESIAGWAEIAATSGRIDESAEHEQVWDDLIKLLDEAADTLGAEPMSGARFREVIESGLSDFTLGLVPATIDQVLVSSIERSRHPPVRAVFVLGFSEGLFPARLTEDAIFADEHRTCLERFGVALGAKQTSRLLDERMLAYIAFTRPSEFLWVSYPQADEEGKTLGASLFMPALCAATGAEVRDAADWLAQGRSWPPDGAIISSPGGLASRIAERMRAFGEGRLEPAEAATWQALYEWTRNCKPLQPTMAAALRSLGSIPDASLTLPARRLLWKKPYRISVTALETYAACSFQHFAGYGLRLEPRPLHELSRLDLGRIYHDVLEQYVNELNESGTTLGEASSEQIAGSLSRIIQQAVPRYAEEIRLESGKIERTIARGERELTVAKEGERFSLGGSKLKPVATERAFGMSGDDGLPALLLTTKDGKTIELRGKMDRVDVLQVGDANLAVVFDYKRSLGRSLRLDEAYHGLALQLLSYLLVIRDHGDKLTGAKLVPGGAFYLPLLAGLRKVDHPSDVESGDALPQSAFRPRGVVDFDWINELDPSLENGWSERFLAYRKADGSPGNLDSTDAMPSGKLPELLEHMRNRMSELASRWIDGDISVTPAMLGTWTPCGTCSFRSVCRIEYATRNLNRLESMSRGDVIERVGRESE